MKKLKIAIFGLGNVGTNFLRILSESGSYLEKACGSHIEVAYAGDSRTTVGLYPGASLESLLEAKATGRLSAFGRQIQMEEALSSDLDAIVDMSSASKDGQREKNLYKLAFSKGINVITANKSPLALHWAEIIPEAEKKGLKVLHEATVAGGVPLFNFLKYSCGPSRVQRFHGIVSLTANFVLKLMHNGTSFEEAVKIAQNMGIAEADYTDDTSGLDAARKCVIVANSLFGKRLSLKDIKYSGIPQVDEKDIKAHGSTLRLVTEISTVSGKFELSSGFRNLDSKDYLLTLGESSLGYEVQTDNNGTLRVSSAHDGPRETASAVVNDVMLLARYISRQ